MRMNIQGTSHAGSAIGTSRMAPSVEELASRFPKLASKVSDLFNGKNASFRTTGIVMLESGNAVGGLEVRSSASSKFKANYAIAAEKINAEQVRVQVSRFGSPNGHALDELTTFVANDEKSAAVKLGKTLAGMLRAEHQPSAT